MPVKLLKVIPYERTVALEYEAAPGYPDTFTMSWESLEAQLEVRERTDTELRRECVALAALLLRQKVEAAGKEQAASADLLDIANEAMRGEG